jgi:hypothetical protein
MKNTLFGTFVVLFTLALTSNSIAGECGYLEYREGAKAIIKAAKRGTIDIKILNSRADKLIKIGSCYAKEFLKINSTCKPILHTIIDNVSIMKNLDIEQIEELYHDGGVYEKKGVDVDDKKYAECLEIAHLTVHPSTVFILLKMYQKDKNKKHLKTVQEELLEIFHHVDKAREAIK